MIDRQAYAHNPHGGSDWVQTPQEIGPLLKPGGPHLGVFRGKHALSWHGDGPILTTGGAGSSKGAAVVIPTALNLKARGSTPVFLTDPAGQTSAVVGVDFCFNPSALLPGRLSQHGCNPVALLKPDSPTLFEDCAAFADALVERSGNGEAKFWDEYTTDVARIGFAIDALINGGTSLPGMWHLIRSLSTNDKTSDDLFQTVFTQLTASPFATKEIMQDAIELFDLKKNNEKVWTGVMATLKNAIGMTAAPSLSKALTGNDFTLEVLVNAKLWKGKRAPTVGYCIPGEQKHNWRAVTRVFAVAVALLARRRKDMSVRPYLLIDEAGALGNSPFVTSAFSEDRKFYQSHFVFQSYGQLEKNFGPAGAREIMASASVRQFLGANDPQTAKMISEMLGTMTLQRQDPIGRDERRHRAQSALRSILLNDVSVLETWLHAAHENHQSSQMDRGMPRQLLTPAEVLTMPATLQVIFVSGFNPILAERCPYYKDPRFKGRYASDPYHPAQKSRLRALLSQAFA